MRPFLFATRANHSGSDVRASNFSLFFLLFVLLDELARQIVNATCVFTVAIVLEGDDRASMFRPEITSVQQLALEERPGTILVDILGSFAVERLVVDGQWRVLDPFHEVTGVIQLSDGQRAVLQAQDPARRVFLKDVLFFLL